MWRSKQYSDGIYMRGVCDFRGDEWRECLAREISVHVWVDVTDGFVYRNLPGDATLLAEFVGAHVGMVTTTQRGHNVAG